MNQDHYFGATTVTNLNVVGAAVICLAGILILTVRRPHILPVYLFAALLIPNGNTIVVGGTNFNAMRLLITCALLRVWLNASARRGFKWRPVHRMVAAWVASSVITFTILWANLDALINRLGLAYSVLGSYFVIAILVRQEADIQRVMRVLSCVCVISGLVMTFEHFTLYDPFAYIGGVPLVSTVREGKVRAQGPFVHPLCAGTLGATLIPMFVGVWRKSRRLRWFALFGIFGGLLMTAASMSSTPILGLLAGIGGLLSWPLREHMKLVRRGALGLLVLLHIVMQGPVWSLIAKVDVIGGSGYQRYELVNQAILHFSEWWALGVRDTYSWGWDMWDTINWYVTQATSGGLITLAFFVAVIVCGFKDVGSGWRRARGDASSQRFLWALGCSLFANSVAFIGVGYLDQSVCAWYALLITISTASRIPGMQSRSAGASATRPIENTCRFVNSERFVS